MSACPALLHVHNYTLKPLTDGSENQLRVSFLPDSFGSILCKIARF